MSLLVKINQSDNVAIAVQPLSAGSEVEGIHINQDIPQAHKVALADIPKGSPVIRYGVILGYAMNRSNAATGSTNSCSNSQPRHP